MDLSNPYFKLFDDFQKYMASLRTYYLFTREYNMEEILTPEYGMDLES